MSGSRTRRRRGHHKGKSTGFRSVQPAQKSETSTDGGSNASAPSSPSQPTPEQDSCND